MTDSGQFYAKQGWKLPGRKHPTFYDFYTGFIQSGKVRMKTRCFSKCQEIAENLRKSQELKSKKQFISWDSSLKDFLPLDPNHGRAYGGLHKTCCIFQHCCPCYWCKQIYQNVVTFENIVLAAIFRNVFVNLFKKNKKILCHTILKNHIEHYKAF